jgi:hypothetical protein
MICVATLRNFGLKVGIAGAVKFEARIKELVNDLPDLAVLVEPLLVCPTDNKRRLSFEQFFSSARKWQRHVRFRPKSGHSSARLGVRVSTRSRQIFDKAAANKGENDRYCAGLLLRNGSYLIRARHNYVRCHIDQLYGKVARFLSVTSRPSLIKLDVMAVGPA